MKNRAYQIIMAFITVMIALAMTRPPSCRAEELITADKALHQIFHNAKDFQRREITLTDVQVQHIEQKAQLTFAQAHSRDITYYEVNQDGAVTGYAFEDTVVGKWGPIHYLVGLNKEGKVMETVILDYQEIRGRPIAKRRFLRQYTGKSSKDPLQLRHDIDGISGATISSRSLTEGIRKILFIFEEIKP